MEKKLNTLLPAPAQLENYFDRLWPICRSITGDGFRASLKILQELIPLELVETPSGTRVFDWTIPKEWNIRDAYIKDESGRKIVDFKQNNLHLLGYSTPIDKVMEFSELEPHLYSLPDQPDAIPYLTSYYQERWGFCMTEVQRRTLKPGKYHVVIDSTLQPGSLTYGHLILPSTTGSKEEILLSTYLCHPSMANNELSGPLVTAFLYDCLKKLPIRKYNYRFVFAPETIGAITYLAQHGTKLKENCRAGLVITCVGDERQITYKQTRTGNTILDRCTANVLTDHRRKTGKSFDFLDFVPSGSDERQYCSPGFNLPVGSLMRTMFATYPEYHTSLDNKAFVSFPGMVETVLLYLKITQSIEQNDFLVTTVPHCEPMLGPRGLYPTLSSKETEKKVLSMLYLLNYSDGEHDLCWIADKAQCSLLELAEIAGPIKAQGLLKRRDA